MSEPPAIIAYLDALFPKDKKDKDVDPERAKLGPDPYQSLYYFQGTSTSLLTTRDEASAQIRERFSRAQSVVVIGGSGCGKSSLVRGKVLDELRNVLRPIPGRDGDWQAVVFRPVTKPLRQFTDAFWRDVVAPAFAPVNKNDYDLDNVQDRRAFENEDKRRSLIRDFIGQGNDEHAAKKLIEDELIEAAVAEEEHQGFVSARRLADQINLISSEGRRPGPLNLMIIIDQFEEAFGTDLEEDDATLEKLWGMIRHLDRRKPKGVYLVLSMRAEDVHRCSAVPGMADIVNTSVFLVDWLNDADLRKAIVDPARIVLRDWGVLGDATAPTSDSDLPYAEGVVERLLGEVEKLKGTLDHKSDHLPLLQHGLHVLWRNATNRWGEELKAGRGGDFRVTDEDLPPQTNATADLWLKAQLEATAEACLADAVKKFDDPAPDSEALEESALQKFDAAPGPRLGIPGEIAVRAALCSMAWRDENGIFCRRFVKLGKLVKERLLPDAPDRLDEAQTTPEKALGYALGVFVDARLLICEKDGEHDTYTVAHEALIRNWPTLRRWVEEEDELVRAYVEARGNDKDGKVTYSIHPRYKDALAATCGWRRPKKTSYARTYTPAWLQEVLMERLKKRLKKGRTDRPADPVYIPAPPKKSNYALTFTPAWLQELLERLKKWLTGRPADPANIPDLIRGVKWSWRLNYLGRLTPVLLLGLCGLALFWWSANQETDRARRWAEALLLAKNSEIEKLSDDGMLSEMILAFEHTGRDEGEFLRTPEGILRTAKGVLEGILRTPERVLGGILRTLGVLKTIDGNVGPEQFIPYSQLIMEWRRRMGAALQVTLQVTSEESPGKSQLAATSKDHPINPLCQGIESTFRRDNLDIKVSKFDGIKFSDLTHQELPIAIKNNYSDTTFSNKELIRLPPNSYQVCVSPDAHVLTISSHEVPYPVTYLLTAIRGFNESKKLVGVVVEPLTGPTGQIPKSKPKNSGDLGTDQRLDPVVVGDITESDDSGERKILYTYGSSHYIAFISDGLLSPAPTPRKIYSPKNKLDWKPVASDLGNCAKFDLQKDHDPGDYVRFDVNAPYIGQAGLIIRRFVSKTVAVDEEAGRYALYVVSLHSSLWGCYPMGLGSFISSPIEHMRPNQAGQSLYLEILDEKSDKDRVARGARVTIVGRV